jgi:hypothetical protein
VIIVLCLCEAGGNKASKITYQGNPQVECLNIDILLLKIPTNLVCWENLNAYKQQCRERGRENQVEM